jgi:glycerol-3-phosphate dehydrogenase
MHLHHVMPSGILVERQTKKPLYHRFSTTFPYFTGVFDQLRMGDRFSFFERSKILQRLAAEQFDLVVIGGGITGAGIGLDAASRGLNVAVIEKHDFAYGTSSRSTKLIHGGLRYLKQFEFGLVKEVGSERAVVHNLAPHLVIPEKMLLPLYEKKGLGYWLTSIGLKIYDFLAGVRKEDQRKMLTGKQTFKHEPLLKKEGVKGGAIYAEYRTDDARLTIEIAKSAARYGASMANYLCVTDFIYDNERIVGVEVRDEIDKNIFLIRATSVINAAGPWVDDLREINKSKVGKRLHLTKGVHIVVPHLKFPIQQAIYYDVEDGRMVFAIPRGRVTYIGTTDTNYVGDKDNVTTSAEDAAYLIRGVYNTFTGVDLTVDDIESSWAGLRPLIHEDGKSASELSRKDEIFESPTGLISIAGGKLTGYRKMAERVVNLVVKKYFADRALGPVATLNIKLNTEPFTSYKQVKQYTDKIASQLKPFALSGYTPRYLVETYGKQTDIIMKQFLLLNEDVAELGLLKAEAWFTVNNEMVCSLEDFFVRRTGLIYFEIRKVIRFYSDIALYMQTLLRWNAHQMEFEMKKIQDRIEEATQFKVHA